MRSLLLASAFSIAGAGRARRRHLKLTFDGAAGYDVTIDTVRLVFETQDAPVPAPAAIGVFAVGLAGLALVRRRRFS